MNKSIIEIDEQLWRIAEKELNYIADSFPVTQDARDSVKKQLARVQHRHVTRMALSRGDDTSTVEFTTEMKSAETGRDLCNENDNPVCRGCQGSLLAAHLEADDPGVKISSHVGDASRGAMEEHFRSSGGMTTMEYGLRVHLRAEISEDAFERAKKNSQACVRENARDADAPLITRRMVPRRL